MSVISKIKNLFKSDNEKLQDQTIETKTIVVSKKNAFYHEVVQREDGAYILRIYNRKTSEVVADFVAKTKEKVQAKALEELSKYNKGV